MGAPKTQQQMSDELNRRFEELSKELEMITQAFEESRRRRQKPALVFPFSLVDRLINAGLLGLERLVRRLVTAIVR